MGELLFRIKRFYRWEEREMRDLLITILAVAFIFAYNDGSDSFVLGLWVMNLIKVLLISAISVLAYDAGMKIAALQQGYRAEYRMWLTGIGIGIIVTILSKGKIPVLLIGGLFLHHHMILRIGKFRYGINRISQGAIAACGPLANLIVMTIALAMSKQLHILPSFFDTVARINGFMVIYQLLPIPKTNGFHIFFMSRLGYVFITATLAGYVILTLLGVYSWILALLIGILSWFLWLWFMEGLK